MKSSLEQSGRKLLAVTTLAALTACKEAPQNPTVERVAIRNIVDAGAATFEGHTKAFIERLVEATLFTDINHEDCELIATALSNETPGTALLNLKNQAVMPDMHREGSDAALSGQEYINITVAHCRTPNRYMSCAIMSDTELTTYATIVEEYVTSHPRNPQAARMTNLVRGLRAEVEHRQLIERARAAGFIR